MNNLKKYRKEMEFTQQQVSDYVGISREHYCRMERNGEMPGLVTADALAHLFRVTVYELWPDLTSAMDYSHSLRVAQGEGETAALDSMLRMASDLAGKCYD